MERKMRGGGGGEKGWNMIKRQKRIIVKVSAETVREPCVCWKRADEADGSGEEDVDDDEDDDENDDADCDDWECEFGGWGMPLEAMVVAVVPFPVIFVSTALKVSV